MSLAMKKSLLKVDYGRDLLNLHRIPFADHKKKRKLILHFSHKNIETLCNYLLLFLGPRTSVQFSSLHPIKQQYSFGNDVLIGITLVFRKQANNLLECCMNLLELPANAVLTYAEPPSSEYDTCSEISDVASMMDFLYINDVNLVDNPNVVKDIRYITMPEDEDILPRSLIEEQHLEANPEFFRNFCNDDDEAFRRFREEIRNINNETLEVSLPRLAVESDFTELPMLPETVLPPEEPAVEAQLSKKRVFRCHYEDVLQLDNLENVQFKEPLPASMFHYDDMSGDEGQSVEVTSQPKTRRGGRGRGRKDQNKINRVTTIPSYLLNRHNHDPSWKTKERKVWESPNVPSFDLYEPFISLESRIQFEVLSREIEAIEEEEEFADWPSLAEEVILLRAEALRAYLLPQGIGEVQEHIDLPMVPLHESLIHPVSEFEGQITEGMDITAQPSNITGAAALGSEISVALAGTSHQSLLFRADGVEVTPQKRRRMTDLIQDRQSQQIQAETLQMLQELAEPPLIDQPMQMFEPVPEFLPQEQMVVEPPLVEQPVLLPMIELSPRRLRSPRPEIGEHEGQQDTTSPRRKRRRRRRRLIAALEEDDEQLAIPLPVIGEQAIPLPVEEQIGEQAIPLPVEEQIGEQDGGQDLGLDLSKITKEYLWDKLKNEHRVLRFTNLCPRGNSRLIASSIFSLLIEMWGERLVSLTQKDSTGNPDQIYITVIHE